jgi:hypothetical protein
MKLTIKFIFIMAGIAAVSACVWLVTEAILGPV